MMRLSQRAQGRICQHLPGSFDTKCLQLSAFIFVQLMFHHSINTASARPALHTGSQIGQILWRAGCHNLHVAVFSVANPAAKLQLAGFPMHKPAKPNSLHPSLNQKM
jgi:hypothetical protein